MEDSVRNSIYGPYEEELLEVMERMEKRIRKETLYEHILARLKDEQSMREKCARKGLPETTESALIEIRDAIGFRIVCGFVDDIYEDIRRIRAFNGITVISEKDYIRNVKPNGYRSYHMILKTPGITRDFYMEIQLRTIAMDSWASLEHQMKYKRNVRNQDLIVQELKRCADELASCDISMQTIRKLIEEDTEHEDSAGGR